MNRLFWVACFALLVVLVNLPDPQPDDLEQQQALYCEMVKTFKETQGQYGWPDYRGNAAEVCK
jgi:hypothetical protein